MFGGECGRGRKQVEKSTALSFGVQDLVGLAETVVIDFEHGAILAEEAVAILSGVIFEALPACQVAVVRLSLIYLIYNVIVLHVLIIADSDFDVIFENGSYGQQCHTEAAREARHAIIALAAVVASFAGSVAFLARPALAAFNCFKVALWTLIEALLELRYQYEWLFAGRASQLLINLGTVLTVADVLLADFFVTKGGNMIKSLFMWATPGGFIPVAGFLLIFARVGRQCCPRILFCLS